MTFTGSKKVNATFSDLEYDAVYLVTHIRCILKSLDALILID